ncbi:hypothetical protein VIGAN_10087700 [Vigna angularis var. angularis]|uniref:Uncharacterized protein n=1 Tax=Vigna angularis var. angularis TaxID=157739 RepID=A0A0S3T2W8_PHAAN|nr:hypothetical protein VIGAN_10087700 [Vigna angularis var. angularis]
MRAKSRETPYHHLSSQPISSSPPLPLTNKHNLISIFNLTAIILQPPLSSKSPPHYHLASQTAPPISIIFPSNPTPQ